MNKIRCLCVAICVFIGLGGRSPTFGQALTADEIAAKFLEKNIKDSLYVADNFIHEEIEITENIKNRIVAEREKKLYVVKRDKEGLYKKLVSRNEIPVSNSRFELKKDAVFINPGFFNKYLFILGRSEIFEGKKYWILSFEPKKNLQEEKWGDRVYNNLAGEMWVAQSSFDLAKLSFHLIKEVNYAWPSFTGGKIVKLGGTVITGLISGHLIVSHIQIEYEYSTRTLFWPKNSHEIKTIHYQNYERRNPR